MTASSARSSARRKPQVDQLARQLADVGLPHGLLVEAVRSAYAAAESDDDPGGKPVDYEALARAAARQLAHTLLTPAINATGVLLHTNLGRAPLVGSPASSPSDKQSDERSAGRASNVLRASNLEIDLATGQRGSRHAHLAPLLTKLTGAQDAVVVNNCAAAVTLVLAALAGGQQVAVSRGEMVEIGGGFRIPEVIAQSGAQLRDVGTTNRTRVADYIDVAAEPDSRVAVLLKVHPSNFSVTGFTQEASVAEIAQGAQRLGASRERARPVVVADVGSGLLDAACGWLSGPPPKWLEREPAVRQTLEAGADLVTFSGDKLLGGPQAGIICGRADLVARCAKHPLMRAFRPGSLVLAELQRTLLAYLSGDVASIGFWRQATLSVDELEARAQRVVARVPSAQPLPTEALCGAGSLPDETIASFGVAVSGDVTEQLRMRDVPVIARVRRASQEQTIADLRTVDPADDDELAAALVAAIAS